MVSLRFYSVLFAAAGLSFSARGAGTEGPPTLRLPNTVSPASYKVKLTLDPTKDSFTGSITIALNVRESVRTIWLNAADIHVQQASITAGGKALDASTVPGGADFLGFQFAAALPPGKAELTIQYTGSVRKKDSSGVFQMEDNGNHYIYTQFESTDARGAFPCFDEPSYKVPWQLTVDFPEQDTAISNTPVERQDTAGGRKTVIFRETKPLPSYLVAFAVGPFDFVDAGHAGRNHVPVRIVTPRGHASEAKYAAEVTATILTRLEDYFGIPYPYEKSDNVAIPVTFGFGAMENAGMVTYGQTIILATLNAIRRGVGVNTLPSPHTSSRISGSGIWSRPHGGTTFG